MPVKFAYIKDQLGLRRTNRGIYGPIIEGREGIGSTDREEAEDRDDIHGEAFASRKLPYLSYFRLTCAIQRRGYCFSFYFSLSLGYLGRYVFRSAVT